MAEDLDAKLSMIDIKIDIWNRRKARFEERIQELTEQKAAVQAAKAKEIK